MKTALIGCVPTPWCSRCRIVIPSSGLCPKCPPRVVGERPDMSLTHNECSAGIYDETCECCGYFVCKDPAPTELPCDKCGRVRPVSKLHMGHHAGQWCEGGCEPAPAPVELEPGCEWRPCLCGEIDPEDRPCISCEAQGMYAFRGKPAPPEGAEMCERCGASGPLSLGASLCAPSHGCRAEPEGALRG